MKDLVISAAILSLFLYIYFEYIRGAYHGFKQLNSESDMLTDNGQRYEYTVRTLNRESKLYSDTYYRRDIISTYYRQQNGLSSLTPVFVFIKVRKINGKDFPKEK